MTLPHSRRRYLLSCLIVLALVIGRSAPSFGQFCGTSGSPPQNPSVGGMFIPSGNGANNTPSPAIIYAIVLFIEFPDDQSTSTSWPKMAAPTLMMSDIIDAGPNVMSGNKYNITTYLRDMSGGKLVVVGKPVYKVARYSLAKYQSTITQTAANAAGWPGDAGINFSGNVRYWATRHALEEIDKRDHMDFTPFDLWTLSPTTPYTQSFNPDGHVDMIFTCWRNDGSGSAVDANGIPIRDASFAGINGIADLGRRSNGMDPSLTVGTTNPDPTKIRTIDFGFPGFGQTGSGVTVLNMGQYPRMDVVFHEFGHYLFGGDEHQYEGGVWTMMGNVQSTVGTCMNAYERSLLGWCNVVDITTNGQTVAAPDFATVRVAYRLTVNELFEQYFWFENHQRLNSPFITTVPSMNGRPWGNANADPLWNVMSYDIVDQTANGSPGLYVLQQEGVGGGCLSAVCADGRWSWVQGACPGGVTAAPWDPLKPLAVWERGSLLRSSGTCDRGVKLPWKTCDPIVDQPADFMWAWRDPISYQTVNTIPKHRGDGNDAWAIGEEFLTETENAQTGHAVFTPWSNPSTRSLTQPASVGMEILAYNQPTYTLKFYTTTPEDAPPSIPQQLRVNPEYGLPDPTFARWPKLMWEVNVEPDVNPHGSYEIWRRNEPGGYMELPWELAGTVAGNVTQFVDFGIWLNGIWSGNSNAGDLIRYKIRAIDEQGKKSIFSESRTIDYGTFWTKPIVHAPEAPDLALECLPNATRSTTTITYSIPSDGMAALVITDILGNEIMSLVPRQQMKHGRYTAMLNAGGFPAGVYLATLRYKDRMVSQRIVVQQ